ncbi:SMI1/KNR4 family protein [Pontibacter sp. JAM-7]|uniref:SMI1/KNR4 family protein n=1 Tax=Pontibacter sp. JAM-7 TaxID=3366581 RepID=UPI003AF89754
MDETIERLRAAHVAVPTPLELPDEDQLVELEEELLIGLPREYKQFLLSVSDVVYGALEPATAADPGLHTHLPDLASRAWNEGLPRYLIPVCESPLGFYAISQEGNILYWAEGELTEDDWPSIWDWAEEVWLES